MGRNRSGVNAHPSQFQRRRLAVPVDYKSSVGLTLSRVACESAGARVSTMLTRVHVHRDNFTWAQGQLAPIIPLIICLVFSQAALIVYSDSLCWGGVMRGMYIANGRASLPTRIGYAQPTPLRRDTFSFECLTAQLHLGFCAWISIVLNNVPRPKSLCHNWHFRYKSPSFEIRFFEA